MNPSCRSFAKSFHIIGQNRIKSSESQEALVKASLSTLLTLFRIQSCSAQPHWITNTWRRIPPGSLPSRYFACTSRGANMIDSVFLSVGSGFLFSVALQQLRSHTFHRTERAWIEVHLRSEPALTTYRGRRQRLMTSHVASSEMCSWCTQNKRWIRNLQIKLREKWYDSKLNCFLGRQLGRSVPYSADVSKLLLDVPRAYWWQ